MYNKINISFVLLTLVYLTILIGYSHFFRADRESFRQREFLVEQNSQRIRDIQISRINSCRETYEGIRKVFLPFFPPEPRSREQRADVEKFNNIINKLKSRCVHQIKVPRRSNGG